jgi:hypothetical protein
LQISLLLSQFYDTFMHFKLFADMLSKFAFNKFLTFYGILIAQK